MSRHYVDNYGFSSFKKLSPDYYITPLLLKHIYKLKPKRILDYGCGYGRFSKEIKDWGFDVTGIDVDKKGIEIANNANPDIPFHLLREDDPLDGELFDCIISIEVIEHMLVPSELPQYAYRHLSEDGCLLLTTPYHGYLKNLAIAVSNQWDKHHSTLRDGGHIKFFSKGTIRQLLVRNGFQKLEIFGVGRIPYLWKSMFVIARR